MGDLFTGCISFFYYLFYSMEDEGILNPDSLQDMCAIHCVFLPIIQRKLDQFRSGWACHRLRTERNMTPMQLWISGLRVAGDGSSAIEGLEVRPVMVLYAQYLGYRTLLTICDLRYM